jgi:hypothetical protein
VRAEARLHVDGENVTPENPNPSSPLLRPLRRGRRAWFAFSLSLFCPGWGHLYSGAIKRGLLFAAVAVFMGIPVIAWMWAACIQGPASMLGVALATAALVLVVPLDSVRAARRLPRPRLAPGRAVALHALFVPLAFALVHAELHWIRSCLVQPFRTPTESMVPTLLPGDYFLGRSRCPLREARGGAPGGRGGGAQRPPLRGPTPA